MKIVKEYLINFFFKSVIKIVKNSGSDEIRTRDPLLVREVSYH